MNHNGEGQTLMVGGVIDAHKAIVNALIEAFGEVETILIKLRDDPEPIQSMSPENIELMRKETHNVITLLRIKSRYD